mmetsp:Transcript_19550/g.32151  ORF Transcript_19550/g.32151 Transcript_19550/m.32151 type:complete len:548 (-) Transcript_19550:39-1682(-)
MSLAARISEERERLAAAKERLRGRFNVSKVATKRGDGRPRVVVEQRQRVNSQISSNRRFDYRSPKSTGVSVKVHAVQKKSVKSPRVRNKSQDDDAYLKSSYVLSDSEFEKRLRKLTAREAAMSARSALADKKLEYAEAELTAKTNLCDEIQKQVAHLQAKVDDYEKRLRKIGREKADGYAERDIARKRVYGLSEKVSGLERELNSSRTECLSTQQRFIELERSSEDKISRLENELREVRVVFENTMERLEQARGDLDQSEKQRADQDPLIDTLSTRCTELEGELDHERTQHRVAAHALELLQLENDKLKKNIKTWKGRSEEECEAIATLGKQLDAERERGWKMEQSLKKELEGNRLTLRDTQLELESALSKYEETALLARSAEERRIETVSQYEEKNKHLEEQLARTQLNANSQADMYSKQISDLLERVNGGLSSSKASTPSSPRASIEELVVDIDLPSGESVELILKSTDDPHEVISNFSRVHSLSPRVCEHLEGYIRSQLEAHDVPPPPPPPVENEVKKNDDTSLKGFKKNDTRAIHQNQRTAIS